MANYNLKAKKLNVADFQHPADKQAVDAVLAIESVEKVLNYVSEHSIEKFYSFINNSSRLKISSEMSPKMHQMLLEAAQMYGTDVIPNLYLERNYDLSVNLDGAAEPYIVLPSALLERADDQMLWGALSGGVAAIQAKHGILEFIENILALGSRALPFAVDATLKLAINKWERSRVYTVDRAVLLATENFELTARYILLGKASDAVLEQIGLDQPDNTYYQQAVEFIRRSGVSGMIQQMETAFSDSQWAASRYIELYNWYVGGEYYDILEGSVDE